MTEIRKSTAELRSTSRIQESTTMNMIANLLETDLVMLDAAGSIAAASAESDRKRRAHNLLKKERPPERDEY